MYDGVLRGLSLVHTTVWEGLPITEERERRQAVFNCGFRQTNFDQIADMENLTLVSGAPIDDIDAAKVQLQESKSTMRVSHRLQRLADWTY